MSIVEKDEMQWARAVNAIQKDKINVVKFGNPFLINEYFVMVNNCNG
jgi:hypothetical protein